MRTLRTLFLLFLVVPLMAVARQNPEQALEELRSLAWQIGPKEGRISTKATTQIPKDYAFLDEANTKRFLELMGNPPRAGHYTIAPMSLKWFAVFAFDPAGYVKDDEKINPDELLKTLKSHDATANEERKKLGMGALYTDGWHVLPHYDAQTKRLEWGLRLKTEGNNLVVNYTSRLLGRRGVMSAVLVSEPQALAADTAEFKKVLQDFTFASGEKYTEFAPGDKVAEYGLAALVVGGAAAAAAKSGILKSLGKFLWVIVIGGAAAVGAFIKRIFRGKSPR
jgi:uncharacterized membrane-anchored protein